jgi:hypothetical protein
VVAVVDGEQDQGVQFEIIVAERQPCHGQMERGDPASEILEKVLKCFKINKPSGMALALVDGGSSCFLSPLDEHIILQYDFTTPALRV